MSNLIVYIRVDNFQDVKKKIALLIEPPPAKKIKALPLPIEHKKKRGGKRYLSCFYFSSCSDFRRARKAKERLAQSDLQKAANRIAFGEAEQEVGEHLGDTVGLGMIGGSTGKLKLAHKDFKSIVISEISYLTYIVPLSKKMKTATTFSKNNNPNSGLQSSVAFTPIKGIELENPEMAAQKIKQINNKYFSSASFKKS